MASNFEPYNDEVFYRRDKSRDGAEGVSVMLRLCALTDKQRSVLCANVQWPRLSKREIARQLGMSWGCYCKIVNRLKIDWRCVR